MKRNFESLGTALSRDEAKIIRGGDVAVGEIGGGCLKEYTTGCSKTKPCCSPAKCEINATRSGTIYNKKSPATKRGFFYK